MSRLFIFLACLLLVGCAAHHGVAPVVDIHHPDARAQYHQVSRGDTLYAIAWRYGLDYQALAKQNHLDPADPLHVGQRLRIDDVNIGKAKIEVLPMVPQSKSPPVTSNTSPSKKKVLTKTRVKQKPGYVKPRQPVNQVVAKWYWPTQGKVIESFAVHRKGINIAGKLGAPIYASAGGVVVYSGHGIPGYGNLIIIKHNARYLTAYAHSRRILVKEGQQVSAQQKIAEMGKSGVDKVMLHFEIRRDGRPINPRKYLRKS